MRATGLLLTRFLNEIRVTANLRHANLLPLFDSREVDGLLFTIASVYDESHTPV